MNRFPFFTLSAVCAGALAAGLLQFHLPIVQTNPLRVSTASAKALAANLVEAARESVVLPLASATAAALAPSPGAAPEIASVVLAEPLLIIRGSEAAMTELPRGTRLVVLGDEGRFVRVRHAHYTMTIPRSATISGSASAIF
jgi:hypothetical protein